MAAAARPFLAAHMWSATTATALSMRTTWRTPLTARAATSFTAFGLPSNTGEIAIAAIFISGSRTSMPKSARPLTLSGASSRLNGVPIRVKSFGSFSAILPGVGIGSAATASANSP